MSRRPKTMQLLQNSARYQNIEVRQVALAADTGERKLVDLGVGQWGYSILENKCGPENTIEEIETVSVTGLMEEYNVSEVDLLKLDIREAGSE